MTAEQIIPPITAPMGKFWQQPHRRFIEMDEKSALMSEQTFKGLKDYTGSKPTGAYEGKMWKAKVNGSWFLCWYGKDKDPRYVSINRREILIL